MLVCGNCVKRGVCCIKRKFEKLCDMTTWGWKAKEGIFKALAEECTSFVRE